MSSLDAADVSRTAAGAALAVPGVAALHPGLRRSLAGAAYRVRGPGPTTPPPEAGVRAQRDRRTGAWHLEIRCVLQEDRRALDTARDVRDSVRAAVGRRLPGGPGSVTVIVLVTHITGVVDR
ncbi:hypothetical protein [Streptomyces sp. 8L]|uniref:hypothetical protein n=1 Tax=Streptomyces sp. 8L TaxID=2877242 RepID=UPI001CD7B5D8|nr:hypothetical protein [Streptomyces sp. 8L]MCA1220575.1 hypothetical protein [Streptomyces sp. 8L]